MINLIPAELKQSRAYGRHNVSLLGYSIALLATAVATTGIMLVSLQVIGTDETALKEGLQTSQTEITALESEVKTVEAVADRLETAKLINEQSVSFSELIPGIGAVLPEGVILNSLSLNGGNTDPLQLNVDMTDAGLASVLIRNLVESDLFEAADILSLSPRGAAASTDEAVTQYNFTASLTASFTGTAEAAKKVARAEAAKKAAAAAAAAEAGEKEQ